MIEAVPRPVAADQNNANKEAHSACSVVEWPDPFRGFRARIGESLARCVTKPSSALIVWSLEEEDMSLQMSVPGLLPWQSRCLFHFLLPSSSPLQRDKREKNAPDRHSG